MKDSKRDNDKMLAQVDQALERERREKQKEAIVQVARRFPDRIRTWQAAHGNTMPPIRLTSEKGDEAIWVNRAARRRMKMHKIGGK